MKTSVVFICALGLLVITFSRTSSVEGRQLEKSFSPQDVDEQKSNEKNNDEVLNTNRDGTINRRNVGGRPSSSKQLMDTPEDGPFSGSMGTTMEDTHHVTTIPDWKMHGGNVPKFHSP